MKVGIIIDLVYENLLSGRLGLEKDIKRIDIKEYLPAAINKAVKEHYLTSAAIGKGDIGGLLPDQFISTYEDVEVKKNVNRNLKYIDFPATPVNLLENMGVNGVYAMEGSVDFKYTKNRFKLNGYEEYIGKSTFYWIEGKRVFFYNLSPSVESVLVMMITSISDLNDDDEAPIPMGAEEDVIISTYKFFTNQLGIPDDKIINFNRDKMKG